MRKTPFTLTLILVLSMLLNVSSFAVYENGPQNIEYNRTNAQSYIGMYTTSPNSAYHYFTYPDEGGDCTSFASQVVRAGGMSMTAAVDNPGDSSWYYYTNPSGIMELPDDDPSEYHSLYEALAANGISTEGLPTWVPRDYAVSAIAVKLSDGVLKCSAIYDSTRGGLVIRVIEHTMALSTEAKELDSLGSVYTHNQTEYYILTDDGVTKAGWQDGMLSYVISGQISEAEIKEMINSIQ